MRIVQGDVLETDLHAIAGPDFLLIGNVPYNITTPIVFKALEPPIPRRSVFLVQREVAERMAAAPDTESYGALSINVAVVADVEQLFTVPPTAFHPAPKVESSVVRLTPRETPLVKLESLLDSALRSGGVQLPAKANAARNANCEGYVSRAGCGAAEECGHRAVGAT